MSVRASRFFCPSALGPCRCGLAVELLHNSIPHPCLVASVVFVVPLPAQRSVYLIELLDVLFVSTHHSQFRIEIACNLRVLGSYISQLLLGSGACAAITRVVPKRTVVHLPSNFHDLLILQKKLF